MQEQAKEKIDWETLPQPNSSSGEVFLNWYEIDDVIRNTSSN